MRNINYKQVIYTRILNKLKSIFKDSIDYSKFTTFHDNRKTPETFKCVKHNMWFKKTLELMQKGHTGCPACKKEIKAKQISKQCLTTAEFIKRANAINNNRYTYDKAVYVNNVTPITVTCPIHGDWQTRPANHISTHKRISSGCPKCAAEKTALRCTKTLDQFLVEAKSIHGDKYDYDKVVYKKTDLPVTIVCRKHGEFKQLPYIHLKGHGCPVCSSSRGENKIAICLDELNLRYEREYVLDTAEHRYRFDFYIPKLGLLIEYHGEQHFAPIKYFGGYPKFHKVYISDREKEHLARTKNMYLIVIPYEQYSRLKDFLLFSISRYYRYKDGDTYYKSFLELAKAKNWGNDATYQTAKPYLLYNKK